MKTILAFIVAVAAVLGLAASVATADSLYQDGGATQAIGGGLTTDNGQLDLTVPANAYFIDTPIRLRYIPNSANNLPAAPSGSIWIGQPFTLQLSEWYTGRFISFDKPMTMTVHYNPSDLGGRSEASLRLVRLDQAAFGYSQWVDLPSAVDTANHTVTAQTPSGGDYGLIAGNVAPATAPPSAQAVPMNSAITGRVFYDKNGNGVMDDGDFPVAGAGLKISSGTWSAFTRTDANGNYAFWDLRQSSYTIELVVGPEWAFTTPTVVTGIQVTGQADSRGSADFGMWYKLPQ